MNIMRFKCCAGSNLAVLQPFYLRYGFDLTSTNCNELTLTAPPGGMEETIRSMERDM
jgi:hypothetical protein